MLKNYWNAPRDFETIPRSILRKVLPLDPKSSYPFLSGDTFRSLCTYQFDETGNLLRNPFVDLKRAFEKFIFAPAFPDSRIAVDLRQNLERFPHSRFDGYSLIIHNGDQIPRDEDMVFLSNRFDRVYSVNWLGDNNIITPLPIGLENRSKRRNGVPSDFLKDMGSNLPDWHTRDIDLLVCFSLHTNKTERLKAFEAALNIRGVVLVQDAITPRSYRQLLKRSKFVLSPPGNGPDCHRTWEAIYLGATPVVLKKAWPNFYRELPVAVLTDWSDLENLVLSSFEPSLKILPNPEEWITF